MKDYIKQSNSYLYREIDKKDNEQLSRELMYQCETKLKPNVSGRIILNFTHLYLVDSSVLIIRKNVSIIPGDFIFFFFLTVEFQWVEH